MADMAIQFDGIENLSGEERRIADKVTQRHYPKIQREIKNVTRLVVHIKTHHDKNPNENAPKAKKYSVHLHVEAPTKSIRASSAAGWDLERSLLEAFNDIGRQIKHAFKN